MGFFDERTGGLVTLWKNTAGITALVGTGTAARIYPDQAKQGVDTPFLVYTRGPGGQVHRHLGGHAGPRLSIVHVYCWGDTRAAADGLAEAVKVGTQGYRGTTGGTVVNYAFVDDAPDDGHDPPIDGSDTKRYWTRLVLRIVHTD